jgi:hypothetical protein
MLGLGLTLAKVGACMSKRGASAPVPPTGSINEQPFSLASNTVTPPELVWEPFDETVYPGDVVRVQGDDDRNFGSLLFDNTYTLTSTATPENAVFSGLASVPSAPTATYIRSRIERGASVSPWTLRKFGDTTAPVLTISATGSYAEGGPVSHAWSSPEYVTLSFGGTDGALLESFPSGGTSGVIRLVGNANALVATKSSYSAIVTATDDAELTDSEAITLTITPDQPAQFTFTDVPAANPTTPYTSGKITITDVVSGVDIPVTPTGTAGVEYQRTRGGVAGSWTAVGVATTLRLNDEFEFRVTSGAYSTSASGTLNANGISDTWNVNVIADPSGISVQTGTQLAEQTGLGGATTATFNITVTAGDLWIMLPAQGASLITGVTCGGAAMTQRASQGGNDGWYVFNIGSQTAGSKSIVVSYSAGVIKASLNSWFVTSSASLTPASTVYLASAFRSAGSSTSAATLTLPTNGMGVMGGYGPQTTSPDSPFTQIASFAVGGGYNSYLATSTSTAAPSVTNSADGYPSFVAVALSKVP